MDSDRLLKLGFREAERKYIVAAARDQINWNLPVISSFRRFGDSRAPRFVGDGVFPWHPGRRATLAGVRQIGDVVLLRYALSERFRD